MNQIHSEPRFIVWSYLLILRWQWGHTCGHCPLGQLCTSHISLCTPVSRPLQQPCLVARRILHNIYADPQGLAPYTECHLTALDKCPDVPLGSVKVHKYLETPSSLPSRQTSRKQLHGSFELCSGQEAGSEAAIHVMRCIVDKPDFEVFSLVDATNIHSTLSIGMLPYWISVLCGNHSNQHL